MDIEITIDEDIYDFQEIDYLYDNDVKGWFMPDKISRKLFVTTNIVYLLPEDLLFEADDIKYFLDNANLDIHKVAYANSVPFRYKGKPTAGAFKIAFENFTNEIISIFKPDIIIPLGINDEYLLTRKDS